MSNGRRIYISLDSLFDLRMGTLNIINSDFALNVTSDKSYYVREIDSFKHGNNAITKEQYLKVLSKFPDVVLRNSLSTKICSFLIGLITKFIKEAITSPNDNDVSLDVNFFPFSLDESEQAELLNVLNVITNKLIEINIVNIPLSKLTIGYVKNNYRFMIMYEYHTWLNMHTDEIKTNPLRDLRLYVPMIYFDELPTNDQLRELSKINKTSFELTQHNLSPFINIDYLPIHLYCVNGPYNKGL